MNACSTVPLLLIVLLGSLAGCSLFGTDDAFSGDPGDEVATVEGRFTQGFEDSPFHPCGYSGEQWLIIYEPDDPVGRAFRERVTSTLGEANPVYVRLRGAPGEKGRFPGFFIEYDRKFRLTEVLEVRAPRAGDCQ